MKKAKFSKLSLLKVNVFEFSYLNTDLIAGTVTEKRAAGEARAALPVQMMRMVSITHARPVLGASGLTIAFLLSTEMASSVNTELETLR